MPIAFPKMVVPESGASMFVSMNVIPAVCPTHAITGAITGFGSDFLVLPAALFAADPAVLSSIGASAETSTEAPAEVTPASSAFSSDEATPTTGYILIDGPIDRQRERYFKRALQAAKEQELARIIVHINTDGGEVFTARDMLKKKTIELNTDKGDPELIAYVDYRAISAGALIAYGHHQLYLSNSSSIGNIEVINMGQKAPPTLWRSLSRRCAPYPAMCPNPRLVGGYLTK